MVKYIISSNTVLVWLVKYYSMICMIISDTLDRTLGDKRHVVTVELAVHALMESSTSCDMTFEEEVKNQLPADVREAVENGVQSAYLQGNRNGCFKAFMSESSIFPGTVLQYGWVYKSDFMCFWSLNSLSRSCAGFSCRGSKDRYPACKIGARHFCCHGVSLRVPLHAQGTQTLSCAFSHDHLQIMPHLSFCPSGSGSEAGWWAGFGAGDGSGSNCRRRVSESCACESLPATRYCMRHPKSTGKQGFAGYSTFGWYGGESFTNNITMTMCQ